ncbi:MAG: PBP1A family penicillin-binding protein [Spirochaetales bacterium]|nr:PBP1A family penicillin-binding protein [Spirochaetales bacterium]MBP7263478.1 PBP1A family penicillin-binding protein [Spirochaetia bacterium]
MKPKKIASVLLKTLTVLTLVSALGIGVAFGMAVATTKNMMSVENFSQFDPEIPSRILDVNGRVITEFSADIKREIVSIKDLPQHLVDAIVIREDKTFWTHPGFTLKGYVRALAGQILGKNLGGGSTITLQLAGTLYADRRDISYRRKFVELWYALQLERRYSKQEILEMYLNRMIMGPGTYGVEAASKYYFGHSAKEVTLAEAAILAVQLSAPTRYNPLRNPNVARDRSRAVLDDMVDFGFATRDEADTSFNLYWDNFDYTRASGEAYNPRNDKAPWFSEYVRIQLQDLLYGSTDLYRDGLTVHTTLNLDYQAVADRYMARYIEQVNKTYLQSSSMRLKDAELLYAPMAELFSLAFNLEGVFRRGSKLESQAMDYYTKSVNPTVDALALMFGLDSLKAATSTSYGAVQKELKKTTVEGALITLDTEKGYILAMVGGSEFVWKENEFNRATISAITPGSSFKPLFYSAAIDSRLFSQGTLIYDAPMVFYNEDGTPYVPNNYKGEWQGPVLVYQALAASMNIPAVKVLDGIGFDAAISRAAALLDITDPEQIRTTFPRVYPLALGIIEVTPVRMARAFAIFGNQGREVTPIAVRSIEDRNGRVILEPEKDLRAEQKRKGSAIQVVSPQNAYIMTDMLKRVVKIGTLSYPSSSGTVFTYKDADGKKFTIPSAGKTGTSQNWEDAWTVGYTPYMTTAIWFGFDEGGNSLGVSQTGATIAGAAWSGYMSEIHRGLPYKDFAKPATGLVEVTVCAESGLLPTEYCDDGLVTLTYLEGTQPRQYCDLHEFNTEQAQEGIQELSDQAATLGGPTVDSALDDGGIGDLLDSILSGQLPSDGEQDTGTEETEDGDTGQEPETGVVEDDTTGVLD